MKSSLSVERDLWKTERLREAFCWHGNGVKYRHLAASVARHTVPRTTDAVAHRRHPHTPNTDTTMAFTFAVGSSTMASMACFKQHRLNNIGGKGKVSAARAGVPVRAVLPGMSSFSAPRRVTLSITSAHKADGAAASHSRMSSPAPKPSSVVGGVEQEQVGNTASKKFSVMPALAIGAALAAIGPAGPAAAAAAVATINQADTAWVLISTGKSQHTLPDWFLDYFLYAICGVQHGYHNGVFSCASPPTPKLGQKSEALRDVRTYAPHKRATRKHAVN
jgi:hypothetical protein